MMLKAATITKTDGRTMSMQPRRLSYPSASPWIRLVAVFTRLPKHFAARMALARSRRSLARLDPRLVQDIGLSVDEANAEARRPVWDAPLHWKG
jgi:uncharacterized protein YjiS (DUF1127 family)